MKLLSFLTLAALLSVSSCSHFRKCDNKESCSKEKSEKTMCDKDMKKCKDGSCDKDMKNCKDGSCEKKKTDCAGESCKKKS